MLAVAITLIALGIILGLFFPVMFVAAAAGVVPRAAGVPRTVRCECGAPLLWGSRFCANCGRPAAVAPAGTGR